MFRLWSNNTRYIFSPHLWLKIVLDFRRSDCFPHFVFIAIFNLHSMFPAPFVRAAKPCPGQEQPWFTHRECRMGLPALGPVCAHTPALQGWDSLVDVKYSQITGGESSSRFTAASASLQGETIERWKQLKSASSSQNSLLQERMLSLTRENSLC